MANGLPTYGPDVDSKTVVLADRLVAFIARHVRCVIAFSGGVDSAVVAKAAFLALGTQATAITGVGAATSQRDIEDAQQVAASIGVRHLLLPTHEIEDADYQANLSRRCYFCKRELFRRLQQWSEENGNGVILSGTNSEDLRDFRPGIEAATEFHVVAPLVELSIDKRLVRELAQYWQLSISDKPASPCLASRIAYGEVVTIPKIKKIEMAENWLLEQGFRDVRVRLHSDQLARIEIHADQVRKFEDSELRQRLVDEFRSLGFNYVTLDLAGRESGSLNRVLRPS